jgi:hypothetical protein
MRVIKLHTGSESLPTTRLGTLLHEVRRGCETVKRYCVAELKQVADERQQYSLLFFYQVTLTALVRW